MSREPEPLRPIQGCLSSPIATSSNRKRTPAQPLANDTFISPVSASAKRHKTPTHGYSKENSPHSTINYSLPQASGQTGQMSARMHRKIILNEKRSAVQQPPAVSTFRTPESSRRERTPLMDVSNVHLTAPNVRARGHPHRSTPIINIPHGYHDIGLPTWTCVLCSALMWYEERGLKSRQEKNPTFTLCCSKGKVELPLIKAPPTLLRDLFSGVDTRSEHFFEEIRSYNNMFAFTSMGAKLALPEGRGPYVYRIQGQNIHRIGSLMPIDGDTPKFSQLYIYDTDNEEANRIQSASSSRRGTQQFDESLVHDLKNMLDALNPLAQSFRMARDRFRADMTTHVKIKLLSHRGRDGRRYNLPTTSEVAAIIINEPGSENGERDIILQTRSGELQRISELHPSYLALQYPLLFPYAEDGYTIHIEHRDTDNNTTRVKLTLREFFAYRFQHRLTECAAFLLAKKLFQQLVVDAYTMVEASRLSYFRFHQDDLRSDTYMNLSEAALKGNTDPSSTGKRIILPSSFTGGPRYMLQNYQDAMALCNFYGHPDLFITFTCNSKWPEITRLAETMHVSTEDIFDFSCRLFSIKLHELIQDLKKNNLFGEFQAIAYTIEFQKRGLPHSHIVLWLKRSHKISTADDIDKFICAEIPDPEVDPELYSAVKNLMMHGPCGKSNPQNVCMQDGSCTKFFPKGFVERTTFDEDGYGLYKRSNNGRTIKKGKVDLDNRYVVPYNPTLLRKYQAHINVEYCNQSRSIKYLFKYISKGNDRIMATISAQDRDGQDVDEIQKFYDARYISPIDALWRIYEFPIHYRYPSVERLNFHLPNQQNVVFRDAESINDVLEKPSSNHTMFLAWMECNKKYEKARSLTYAEFPIHFVWNPQLKEWTPRVRGFAIGRMYHVTPAAKELYFLRILLNRVVGPTSYEDIRTVDDVLYSSFKEACYALGLLDDEKEYIDAIVESSFSGHASYLRSLFAMLVLTGTLSRPELVWDKTWHLLSDDILYRQRKLLRMKDLQLTEAQLKNYALAEIEKSLQRNGSSLRNYPPMPLPDDILITEGCNKLIQDELSYDKSALALEHARLMSTFTEEQRSVYEDIMNVVSRDAGGLFFLYGYGGTGKTFLWRALSAAIRSKGEIVLTVVSSGIASLLISGGRTSHSRFAIPIDIDAHSTCHIKAGTPLADLICKAKLIIWDEAPMMQKYCFEALDRSLRDVLKFSNPHSSALPFGGKVVVLGGDFRQILPVIPRGTRYDIVSASITSSYLWKSCKVLTLTRNMRLSTDSGDCNLQELREFAEWILQVGDGTLGDPCDADATIEIPPDLLLTYSGDPVAAIVDSTYPSIMHHLSDADYFQDKAILCPTHELVDEVNDFMLGVIPSDDKVYLSSDSILKTDGYVCAGQPLYSTDFLNGVKTSGIPNHVLRLKVGVPIMLMRNIDQAAGLCNGTRLITTHLYNHVIEAKVMSGKNIGEKVFIPRMLMCPSRTASLPFMFQRRQFPISVCFAMTINKSQGQSLSRVGLYLRRPVFTHGQLYVAMSRVTSKSGLKILSCDKQGRPLSTTSNAVYKEIFQTLV